MEKIVTPYKDASKTKKEQVANMFDNIAGSYDFLNHSLSLGIDILWRRKAIRKLGEIKPKVMLDIATGTGDFAIEALKLKPTRVVGLDISEGMLEVGRKKMAKVKGGEIVEMVYGDSENLLFEDNSIDAVTVGFGVRNFENLGKGLSEICRVLRPGGRAAILEPAIPRYFPMKQLFFLYFRGILPFIGKLISGDNAAYTYLPESVRAFPNGKEFTDICIEAGFTKTTYTSLTFGICSMYILEK
ncbi:MAG: bifunctional demethylmenaquinone methyltransferase/2-methoxy-6-polyprenyl-1,4-benzoquinol methylase UbiE [Bacteroidia bacterium]|nr:bifunctional demethylmenaquinone methyltransferase/2-methoxy-6-polyprenyl-1,4-benzoquinol methylase UbiE [Bacteroidia bacterium]